MKRRSREERRQEYLDTAMEILAEAVESSDDQAALALAHVKIDNVAERAHVSKGAIYHIWLTQEAYWADLLQAMLVDTNAAGPLYSDWATVVTSTDYEGPTPTHADLSRVALESRIDNPAFFIRTALHAYPNDGSAAGQLSEEMADIAAIYRSVNTSVLESAGRRLRDDISYEVAIGCLEALVNGLAIRKQFYPEDVHDISLPDHGKLDPYSVVAEAVLLHLSQPINDTTADEQFELGALITSPLRDSDLESVRNHLRSYPPQNHPDADSTDRAKFYIDTGIELLKEYSPDCAAKGGIDALGNIRISAIAKRVGVSKGSLYHIWPSQEAFRLDVLRHLLETGTRTNLAVLNRLYTDALQTGLTPDEILRTIADTAFIALRDNPLFFARFSFALYGSNPEVAEVFRSTEQEISDRFGEILCEIVRMQGRQLREPFDKATLESLAEAALYGMCLTYRISPGTIDGYRSRSADPADQPPSLLAEVLAAFCWHFSEPEAN